MNKSKRRLSSKTQEGSDESAESLLLEENVKKLLDIDVRGPRRRNIFTNAQEPHQKIRRSIISRALRNVISSTPMPTKANKKFFPTESSLNISPITSENDEHGVKKEIESAIFTEPKQHQNVEPDVITVSSDTSDTCESSDTAKSKDLPSKFNTHRTRRQTRKLEEKPANMTKSHKEQNHSIGDRSRGSYRSRSDDRTPNKGGKNASTHRKDDDQATDKNNPISTEKSYKTYKNVSVQSNRIKHIEKSIRTNVVDSESSFHNEDSSNVSSKPEQPSESRKNHPSGNNSNAPPNTLKKNVNSSCLFPIQKPQDFETPGRSNDHVKTASVSSRISRGNITLRKSSQMDSREQFTVEKQNKAGIEDKTEVGFKRLSKLEEKSSKIPVLRTRSKSREKPDELESQARSRSPVFQTGSKSREKPDELGYQDRNRSKGENTSDEENEVALHSSPPKPAPRRRKKKKSAVEKPSKNNHSIQKMVEGVDSPPNVHSAYSAPLDSKTTAVLQKRFVDTGTSPNISPRAKCDPAAIQSLATSTVEQIAESSMFPEGKRSLTGNSFKRETSCVQKQVVDTAVSPLMFFGSSSSIEKSERAKRLDDIIARMKDQTTLHSGEGQLLEEPPSNLEAEKGFSPRHKQVQTSPRKSGKPNRKSGFTTGQLLEEPPSNLEAEKGFSPRHKQVQTSSRKSGKPNRKSGFTKVHCARNIFTKTVAETQTSINNNDDTSSSSRMSDCSKILEEFDAANVFDSLAKEAFFPESLTSTTSYDSGVHRGTPWRFEEQGGSQSSKRISIKLNFLRSAIQIEEERTQLSKKRLENDFDTSGETADYIPYRKTYSTRLKSTFHDYTKKKSAKVSRTFVGTNIHSSELDSDQSASDGGIEDVDHQKRICSEKELQEETHEEDVQPEENTLIDINSSLQTSQAHVEKGNSITPQISKLATPSKILSKTEDTMILKKKSDVETQKNHEVTDSAEKQNENPIIQETPNSYHSQKSIIDPCLENEWGIGLNDSENEQDQEKKQTKCDKRWSRINHSRNISTESKENIPKIVGIKKRSQGGGSEIAVIQTQREITKQIQNGSKTLSPTRFTSSSESKIQNKSKIVTPRGENNAETDVGERDAEHMNTDNCPINSLDVLPADENLEKDTTANGTSHTEKQKILSVMIKKLSKKDIDRNWIGLKILDSEDDDDPEPHCSKKTPNHRNQKRFDSLVVALNQTPFTTPKSTRKVNGDQLVLSANQESQKESTENPKSVNKKKQEPVFKVPNTKSLKNTRKRIVPSSNDDISVTSKGSSPTGRRRSGRDRRPPRRRFVMVGWNPVATTAKSVKSDDIQEEYTTKRDTSKKIDQNKTQTTAKRGRPRKVTALPECNSEEVQDNSTAVLETTNKMHTTNRAAAFNLTEDGDNSTKKSRTKQTKKSTMDSLQDDQPTTSKRPRKNKKTTLNSLEYEDKSTNADNSNRGLETARKITRIDKQITEENPNCNKGIDAPQIQEDPSQFDIGEECPGLDDEMFLKIPNPQRLTSTLMKSNTFDFSNLQSTKRPKKANKPNGKISGLVSETAPVSSTNQVNISDETHKRRTNCLVEDEYVEIVSGSEIVRLTVKSDDIQEEYTTKRDTSKKIDQNKTQTTAKRGRPRKVTALPECNSEEVQDNSTAVLETTNKMHTTNRAAAFNLTEDGDNSTKKSRTKQTKKSSMDSLQDDQPTTSKRPRKNKKTTLNSLEYEDKSTNADNSNRGLETARKITRIDKQITEENPNCNKGIDAPQIQEDPSQFDIGEECPGLDDEMFLKIPNPQNGISRDSGTSTLMKSNTFDFSNLQSTKRPKKANKPNGKISGLVSETAPVSSTNQVNISDETHKRRTNCLVEDEYVEIVSGSEIVRLKYVEKDVTFKVCQDNLSLTNFLRGVNGTTMGYLKLPPNGMKPLHSAKKHSLVYFVLEGEGKLQVRDRTSRIAKFSHFMIPLGFEYSIVNDVKDDMVLACVRVEEN